MTGQRSASAPAQDSYDVVVVGTGLGGLVSAALLANAGYHVLAIEREDGPGGCAHAFRRGPYTFDPAIHFTVEAGPGRFLDLLLRHLGVAGECDLVRVGELWRASYPDVDVRIPTGSEAFVAAHAEVFPHEAKAIAEFEELRRRFFGDAVHIGMQLGLSALDDATVKFPTFFRYRNATLQDVLDDTLSDPRAKALLSSMWPYQGLPPSRLSFYIFAQFLSVFIEGGSYYSRGSFQRLADAFVTALTNSGGELVLGREVERIEIDGEVRGVQLDDGTRVRSPIVISNADARVTLERLVGEDHAPSALLRRVRRLTASCSAVVVTAVTGLDLEAHGAAHETFLYRHWDHEKTWADIRAGRPGGMWVNVPTLADPSLAPPGEHVVILTSLAVHDPDRPWAEASERYADELVGLAGERLFPGLVDSLSQVEVATPPTIATVLGAKDGAIYGCELTPGQTGSKRMPPETAVPGLYLTGAWTFAGPGSFRAILSGVDTARSVLLRAGKGDALPSLRPAEMPG